MLVALDQKEPSLTFWLRFCILPRAPGLTGRTVANCARRLVMNRSLRLSGGPCAWAGPGSAPSAVCWPSQSKFFTNPDVRRNCAPANPRQMVTHENSTNHPAIPPTNDHLERRTPGGPARPLDWRRRVHPRDGHVHFTAYAHGRSGGCGHVSILRPGGAPRGGRLERRRPR
jgi:hypothetical protein